MVTVIAKRLNDARAVRRSSAVYIDAPIAMLGDELVKVVVCVYDPELLVVLSIARPLHDLAGALGIAVNVEALAAMRSDEVEIPVAGLDELRSVDWYH